MRTNILIIVVAASVMGCATAPLEAQPLEIARTPPKPINHPLVIHRAMLDDVLSRGPGRFFEQMPVTPHRIKGRFVGFRLNSLYRKQPPNPNGIHVGDVVTSVNGIAIKRPDHFMQVWTALKKAKTLRVELIRNSRPIQVTYRIIE